jgi:hypothetical protein
MWNGKLMHKYPTTIIKNYFQQIELYNQES